MGPARFIRGSSSRKGPTLGTVGKRGAEARPPADQDLGINYLPDSMWAVSRRHHKEGLQGDQPTRNAGH